MFAWDAYLYHIKPPATETLDVQLQKVTDRRPARMAARLVAKDPSPRTRLATGAYRANLLRASLVAAPWTLPLYDRLARSARTPAPLRALAKAQVLDGTYARALRAALREAADGLTRRRILLVRSDGIGDALVLAPLVAALRDAGHTLGAVLSTRNAEAFAPGVFAAVHVLERIPWPRHGSTPQSYAQALAEARAQRYDVALIASEEPEAYTFPRAANIPQRIGFANGFEKPLKSAWVLAQVTRALTRPASAQRAQEHEVETLFRLGKNLHAEPHPTRDAARLRPLVVAATAAHGGVVFQLTPKWDDIGVPPDAL